ncbi:MAG: hypothetical protein WBX15_11270 [Thermoanaerobaculia bacterium]
MTFRKPVILTFLVLLCTVAVAGQTVPLTNWPAPARWSPAAQSGQLTAMGDLSLAVPFIAVTPCRVYDSRSTSMLSAAVARTINVDGGPCTGIPGAGVEAYSLNITVFGSTASGSYAFLTAYPAGTTRPTVATLNFLTGSQVGNAAIVPSGSGQDITIYSTAATHVTIDINGYYSYVLNNTNQMVVRADLGSGAAIVGYNYSNTNGSHGVGGFAGGTGVVYGVQGEVGGSTAAGSSGVHGIADTSSNRTYGVYGQSGSTASNAAGVLGIDDSGAAVSTASYISAGVRGESHSSAGLLGVSNYIGVVGAYRDGTGAGISEGRLGSFDTAVYGSTSASADGTPAVFGSATSATGRTYGVWASSYSSTPYSAGVYGRGGNLTPALANFSNSVFGVQGRADDASRYAIGVAGEGTSAGVYGYRIATSTGVEVSGAVLGFSDTVGLHVYGTTSSAGIQAVVEPHPSDPGLVIKTSPLEGNEPGTYFRGRGRIQGGSAVIMMPPDFQMTSDPEGLSMQITPIGDFAQFAVVEIDLNHALVKGSKDVEFFYTVNGIRRGYGDFRAVAREDDFVPRSPDDQMLAGYSSEIKQRLIANGTYNADGTVNLNTAERMGWAQAWRDRESAAKAAAEAAAAQGQPPSAAEVGSRSDH